MEDVREAAALLRGACASAHTFRIAAYGRTCTCALVCRRGCTLHGVRCMVYVARATSADTDLGSPPSSKCADPLLLPGTLAAPSHPTAAARDSRTLTAMATVLPFEIEMEHTPPKPRAPKRALMSVRPCATQPRSPTALEGFSTRCCHSAPILPVRNKQCVPRESCCVSSDICTATECCRCGAPSIGTSIGLQPSILVCPCPPGAPTLAVGMPWAGMLHAVHGPLHGMPHCCMLHGTCCMLQRSVGQPSHEAPHSLHLPFAYSSIAVMLVCPSIHTPALTHALTDSPTHTRTHLPSPHLTSLAHTCFHACMHSLTHKLARSLTHTAARAQAALLILHLARPRCIVATDAAACCRGPHALFGHSAAPGLQVPAAEAVNRSSVAPIVPLVLNPTVSVRSAHGGHP